MSKTGPVHADRLKSFIERVEKLEEERTAIGSDIRDVYAEAKGVGYDVKTMRKVVQLRKMDAADRAEQESLLDVYLHALGMIDRVEARVASGESIRAAAAAEGMPKSTAIRQVTQNRHQVENGSEVEARPSPPRLMTEADIGKLPVSAREMTEGDLEEARQEGELEAVFDPAGNGKLATGKKGDTVSHAVVGGAEFATTIAPRAASGGDWIGVAHVGVGGSDLAPSGSASTHGSGQSGGREGLEIGHVDPSTPQPEHSKPVAVPLQDALGSTEVVPDYSDEVTPAQMAAIEEHLAPLGLDQWEEVKPRDETGAARSDASTEIDLTIPPFLRRELVRA